MTSRVRIIRFARPLPNAKPLLAEGTVVSEIVLDEQSSPAGQILRQGSMWLYILADGARSGLTSVDSRHDLERQVMLLHLGTRDTEAAPKSALPLRLAV